MRLKINSRWRDAKIPPEVIESNLSAYARLAFAMIFWHGDGAFPTRKRLSEMMAVSTPTVKRATKELYDKGWLVKQQRPGRSNVHNLTQPGDPGLSDPTPGSAGPDPQPRPGSAGPDTNSGIKSNQEREKLSLRATIARWKDRFLERHPQETFRLLPREAKNLRELVETYGEEKVLFMIDDDWRYWKGKNTEPTIDGLHRRAPQIAVSIRAGAAALARPPKVGTDNCRDCGEPLVKFKIEDGMRILLQTFTCPCGHSG